MGLPAQHRHLARHAQHQHVAQALPVERQQPDQLLSSPTTASTATRAGTCCTGRRSPTPTPTGSSTGGSPSWDQPIKRMTIEVTAPAGRTYEASFDDFRVGVTGIKTAFLWTFDDGYEENYVDVYPYLESHGQKASMFVIGNWPGTQPPGGTKITLDAPDTSSTTTAGPWATTPSTTPTSARSDQATAATQDPAGSRLAVRRTASRGPPTTWRTRSTHTSQSAVAAAAQSGVIAARQQGSRNEYMPLDEALHALGVRGRRRRADGRRQVDRSYRPGDRQRRHAASSTPTACTTRTSTGRSSSTTGPPSRASSTTWRPSTCGRRPIDEWYNTMAAQGETIRPWAGHYVYVACGTAGVQVVDIADPLNPVIVGSRSTGIPSHRRGRRRHPRVRGQLGWAACRCSTRPTRRRPRRSARASPAATPRASRCAAATPTWPTAAPGCAS